MKFNNGYSNIFKYHVLWKEFSNVIFSQLSQPAAQVHEEYDLQTLHTLQYFPISVSFNPFVQKYKESSEVYFWLTLKSLRHCWRHTCTQTNTHTHTHTDPRLGNTFVLTCSPDDAKWHAACSISQCSDNHKLQFWITKWCLFLYRDSFFSPLTCRAIYQSR